MVIARLVSPQTEIPASHPRGGDFLFAFGSFTSRAILKCLLVLGYREA